MNELTPRLLGLVARVAARPRVLLLLDYDGTLVATRSRPGLARLDAAQQATLARLPGPRLRLGVFSGRSIRNLKERLGLKRIAYGGVFGLEVSVPGWRFVHPRVRALRPAIVGLIALLEKQYRDLPGVAIEDKSAGLTLHYRGVPPQFLSEFSRRLRRAREQSPPGLLWRRGKCAWEVTPRVSWNKGRAALLLWRRLGRPYLLAIGDDRFDEPMLRAARRHGAGIHVGRGPTCAAYRLESPRHVHRFLRALAQRLSSRVSTVTAR